MSVSHSDDDDAPEGNARCVSTTDRQSHCKREFDTVLDMHECILSGCSHSEAVGHLIDRVTESALRCLRLDVDTGLP